MERLPKEHHAATRRVLRQAWELDDADKAEKLMRPSALAVLKLTISSDFVGACTHLALPYESHRLQAPDKKGSASEVQQ